MTESDSRELVSVVLVYEILWHDFLRRVKEWEELKENRQKLAPVKKMYTKLITLISQFMLKKHPELNLFSLLSLVFTKKLNLPEVSPAILSRKLS